MAGARIANGTMDGMKSVLTITSPTFAGTKIDLVGFLLTVPAGSQANVCGHSLGGCLTSVLAPVLQNDPSLAGLALTIKSWTFAAPTAGDAVFANAYDALFGADAYRYYNTLDIVPRTWSDLPGIRTLYPSPGVPCGVIESNIVRAAEDYLFAASRGVPFVQPSAGAVALAGQPCGTTDFFAQLQSQHHSRTYLDLLTRAGGAAVSTALCPCP